MFGYRLKKFIQRFLAAVAAVYFLFNQLIFPQIAAAQVNNVVPLFSRPALTLIQGGLAASTVEAAVDTAAVASLAVNPLIVVGAIAVVGLGWYYWSQSQQKQAQDLAVQKYCLSNPADSVCGDLYRILMILVDGSSVYWSEGPYTPPMQKYHDDSRGTTTYRDSIGRNILSNASDAQIKDMIFVSLNRKAWQEWPQEKREAAVDLLTPDDWVNILQNSPQGGSFQAGDNLPNGAYVFPRDGSSPFHQDGPLIVRDPVSNPDPNPSPSPSPNPSPSPSPNPFPSPLPQPSSPPFSDPNSNPTSNPSSSPSPSPSSSPSPSPSPSPNPEPNTNQSPQVDFGTAENFLIHAKRVFSDKFPFDILGDFEAKGSSNECPKYAFFNHQFELCPIRDFLSMLKIPVIISFLIWAFMSI